MLQFNQFVMKIYSYSSSANYTHIHMYVFFSSFAEEIKERGLEDSNYKLDVSIDGNVAKWMLDTPEIKISKIFKELSHDTLINIPKINEAIIKIEQKNNFTSKIKDMDLLTLELSKVCFTKKKPEITDDSLLSPVIDFYKVVE